MKSSQKPILHCQMKMLNQQEMAEKLRKIRSNQPLMSSEEARTQLERNRAEYAKRQEAGHGESKK